MDNLNLGELLEKVDGNNSKLYLFYRCALMAFYILTCAYLVTTKYWWLAVFGLIGIISDIFKLFHDLYNIALYEDGFVIERLSVLTKKSKELNIVEFSKLTGLRANREDNYENHDGKKIYVDTTLELSCIGENIPVILSYNYNDRKKKRDSISDIVDSIIDRWSLHLLNRAQNDIEENGISTVINDQNNIRIGSGYIRIDNFEVKNGEFKYDYDFEKNILTLYRCNAEGDIIEGNYCAINLNNIYNQPTFIKLLDKCLGVYV